MGWLCLPAAPFAAIPAAISCPGRFPILRGDRFPGSRALSAAVAGHRRRTVRSFVFFERGSRRLSRIVGFHSYRKRRKKNQ